MAEVNSLNEETAFERQRRLELRGHFAVRVKHGDYLMVAPGSADVFRCPLEGVADFLMNTPGRCNERPH